MIMVIFTVTGIIDFCDGVKELDFQRLVVPLDIDMIFTLSGVRMIDYFARVSKMYGYFY